MPRLFVAIDLPEQQRQGLAAVCRGLTPDTRWTPESQIHLTLRFIGGVEVPLVQPIRKVLADLRFRPFMLQIKGLGVFPSRRQPNILWAGVAENLELINLQGAIESSLVQLGFAPETRKYHPHCTVARLPRKLPRELLESYLERHGRFSANAFLVSSFQLYSSMLTGKGAIHRVEETFGSD